MPLHIRPIAVGIAVIFFFGTSFVGWISGLGPFTCCKRALAAAAVGYVVGTVSVRAINAILMNAIIANQVNQQKEQDGAGRD
ncbi:MAG: hypothetical protein ACYST6_17505 [Planctomycetota bacterium]|jgi:hypothetical protein